MEQCDENDEDARYGFDDVDPVRLRYQLLQHGKRLQALTDGSQACFDRSDWNRIATCAIVRPEPGTSAVPMAEHVERFAIRLKWGHEQHSR